MTLPIWKTCWQKIWTPLIPPTRDQLHPISSINISSIKISSIKSFSIKTWTPPNHIMVGQVKNLNGDAFNSQGFILSFLQLYQISELFQIDLNILQPDNFHGLVCSTGQWPCRRDNQTVARNVKLADVDIIQSGKESETNYVKTLGGD